MTDRPLPEHGAVAKSGGPQFEALSKLNMGKSCINFNSVAELPLATIAAILAAAPQTVVTKGKPAATKAGATKAPPRKPAAKTSPKKATAKKSKR